MGLVTLMKVLVGEGLDGERCCIGDGPHVNSNLVQLGENVVVTAHCSWGMAANVVFMAATYLLDKET